MTRKYNCGKYELCLEYTDEQIDEIIELMGYGGDSEESYADQWFALFHDVSLPGKDESVDLIISEDSYGFVRCTEYTDKAELEAEWTEIEKESAEYNKEE